MRAAGAPRGERLGRRRKGALIGSFVSTEQLDGDSAVLKAGQWFALVTPGAGGFGPPKRRDPAAVARDLAEGAIGLATARENYGLSHE